MAIFYPLSSFVANPLVGSLRALRLKPGDQTPGRLEVTFVETSPILMTARPFDIPQRQLKPGAAERSRIANTHIPRALHELTNSHSVETIRAEAGGRRLVPLLSHRSV
jgi:hypothetical protein